MKHDANSSMTSRRTRVQWRIQRTTIFVDRSSEQHPLLCTGVARPNSWRCPTEPTLRNNFIERASADVGQFSHAKSADAAATTTKLECRNEIARGIGPSEHTGTKTVSHSCPTLPSAIKNARQQFAVSKCDVRQYARWESPQPRT